MDKEEFKRKLIENQIFNELKDCHFSGAKYIQNKWDGLDIDYSRVYRRIINYQVKKYGESLTYRSSFKNGMSKEEARKVTIRKNHRQSYYRNKGAK